MRRAMIGAALLGALTLAGCGAGQSPGVPAPVATAPASVAAGALPGDARVTDAAPSEVWIPKIAARSSLIGLGLQPDGQIAVPDVNTPEQASWYTGSVAPGQVGPAVVLGHVNGNHRPGIFARLHELAKGDAVVVARADGTHSTFVIDRVQQIAKDAFPTDAVYGATDRPQIRLITCGGQYDPAGRRYLGSVIAYGSLVEG